MDLTQLKVLLEKANLYRQQEREPSIFGLGGRGYYENPTTDLLAIFLDPTQPHGLSECFLGGLLECLPDSKGLHASLSEAPLREVATSQAKRIDLILRGDDWDMVLENKIFHDQINPFYEYEEYAQANLAGDGRCLLYVVLSPSGQSVQPGWYGLSYAKLINSIRQQLGQLLISKPLDKWQVFARDFLLHLENITVEQTMDAEALNFVFEHMYQINQINALKEKAVKELDNKILERLRDTVANLDCKTRRHAWENGPALRYSSRHWGPWTDVVVYLDSEHEVLKPSIRVYLCNMHEALIQKAKQHFCGTHTECWPEGNQNEILGISWDLERFDEAQILELVSNNMLKLMEFEMKVRPMSNA
jgi:hypothetical protein